MENTAIKTVFKHYIPIASDFDVKQLTSGHLNQTFLVKNNQDRYILQCINTSVFKHLDRVTHNISTVADHLQKKDYPHKILDHLAFEDGEKLYANKWRLFPFFGGCQTFLKVQSAEQAFEAAKFLSEFHWYLKDLSTDGIHEAIEGFLDFKSRQENFENALKTAAAPRLKEAKAEIEFVQKHNNILDAWLTLLPQLPNRLLHADPKISNFLFDENSQTKITALIDWDTLMTGPILYDFGDMVRSYTNLKDEDDPEEKGDNFSLENYQALKDGFLDYLKDELTKLERQNMDLAGKAVIYVQALRFLTDYLNGDVYYAVNYENHNLDRTRNQINLLSDLENKI